MTNLNKKFEKIGTIVGSQFILIFFFLIEECPKNKIFTQNNNNDFITLLFD